MFQLLTKIVHCNNFTSNERLLKSSTNLFLHPVWAATARGAEIAAAPAATAATLLAVAAQSLQVEPFLISIEMLLHLLLSVEGLKVRYTLPIHHFTTFAGRHFSGTS